MKDRYLITWLRQLPDGNIVGHCFYKYNHFLNSYLKSPSAYYFKGTLIKQP